MHEKNTNYKKFTEKEKNYVMNVNLCQALLLMNSTLNLAKLYWNLFILIHPRSESYNLFKVILEIY